MIGRDLTRGSIGSHIWALAWPIMLSIFFQTLYSAVDAIWVGRLSPAAIAAVSISQITLFIMLSLTMGVTVGSGVVMAMSIGRKDLPEAGRILGQSFVLNFIGAVFFTIVAVSLRSPILVLTGATGSILPLAIDYFTIVASGSVLIFLFFAVVFGFNAQGDNRTVTVLFAISSVMNALLDPALIFGWWIFPEMGIRGAAVATLSSQLVLLVLGVTLLKIRPMMVRFQFRNLIIRWHSVRKVLSIGLPAAMTNVIGPIALATVTALVAAAFMEPGAVAFSIGARIEFFGFLPAIGFGVAALSMIAQNVGAHDFRRARKAYDTAVVLAFVMGSTIGVLVAILSRPVVGVFTNDPLISGYARSYLVLVPLSYGVFGAGFVITSSFQGLGKSWYGMLITAVRLSILLGLGLAVTVTADPNIQNLWWVVIAANLGSASVGYLLLRRVFARVAPTHALDSHT